RIEQILFDRDAFTGRDDIDGRRLQLFRRCVCSGAEHDRDGRDRQRLRDLRTLAGHFKADASECALFLFDVYHHRVHRLQITFFATRKSMTARAPSVGSVAVMTVPFGRAPTGAILTTRVRLPASPK